MRALVLVVTSLLLVACDTSPSTSSTGGNNSGGCTASTEQDCACGDLQGTQVCGDSGVYGACSCELTDDEIQACIDAGGSADECGTSPDINDGVCSFDANAIIHPDGGVHGDECETSEDCEYGTCVSSPMVTGGLFKICTKQCNCGENSECSADGKVDGFESTCLRFGPSSYPDEPLTAFCQRECLSVSDCKSFSELYTDCRVTVGATRVCTVTP